MRILNRANFPWFVFVSVASVFALWLYAGNFHAQKLPAGLHPPSWLVQQPSDHRSVGGTPLGLIFGAIAFAVFIFAALLGLRKKLVLWRVGTVQLWMRAHIWLTLLTIPLVILHTGFRFGGPMTTLLVVLYVVVMVSGIYGLGLQHQIPRIMMERLPAESVYEQIPHIRTQLQTAAQKMRDSFKPTQTDKPDGGALATSATKAVTAGSTPMATTSATVSTPTARAKTVVGSSITAESVGKRPATPAANVAPAPSAPAVSMEPKPPETMGTPTARVPDGSPVPAGTEGVASPEVKPISVVPAPAAKSANPPTDKPATIAEPKISVAGIADPGPRSATAAKAPAPSASPGTTPAKPAATPAVPTDAISEATLVEFLDRQILPYLAARNGNKLRLGNARFSEDTFRFLRLRVTEGYRSRVAEMQAWCDERRMLDLQVKLQHWLHGWLFVHVPISFVLLLLTACHAFVTLFYY